MCLQAARPPRRWQPTAADFVIPKGRCARAARRRQTRHAVCPRNRGLRLAPHRQPRAPEARSLYSPETERRARHGCRRRLHRPDRRRSIIPSATSSPSFRARRTASSSSPAITTRILPLPKTYVGANDGGSSTGLLLELADVLGAGRWKATACGWCGWTAKRPPSSWTDTDSLYGSRHLAQLWQQDGTAKKIKAFLLLESPTTTDPTRNRRPWTRASRAPNVGYAGPQPRAPPGSVNRAQ